MASVAVVKCQDETSNTVEIALTNAVQSSPNGRNSDPDAACWQNNAMTPIEVTQDETITTDWHNSEPCACAMVPSTEEELLPWWTAEFVDGTEYKVTEVQILVRYKDWYNYNWDYNRGVEVYIEDTLCAAVPQDGEYVGEWITLTCESAIKGRSIKLQQPREWLMSFCGIKVKGTEVAIPTCDYSQENIWSDEICVGEITAYISSLFVVGAFFGFFILIFVLIIVFV